MVTLSCKGSWERIFIPDIHVPTKNEGFWYYDKRGRSIVGEKPRPLS
jgi:hypothetical protein